VCLIALVKIVVIMVAVVLAARALVAILVPTELAWLLVLVALGALVTVPTVPLVQLLPLEHKPVLAHRPLVLPNLNLAPVLGLPMGLLVVQQLLVLMLVVQVVIILILVGVEHVILPNLLVINLPALLAVRMLEAHVTHAVWADVAVLHIVTLPLMPVMVLVRVLALILQVVTPLPVMPLVAQYAIQLILLGVPVVVLFPVGLILGSNIEQFIIGLATAAVVVSNPARVLIVRARVVAYHSLKQNLPYFK
jgi:hypothetical protein